MRIHATIEKAISGQWLAKIYQDDKPAMMFSMPDPVEVAMMAGQQIALWSKPQPDMGYGSGNTAQHTGD